MNFEFNELTRRLDLATDVIRLARHQADLWTESRTLALHVWSDACAEDMNRQYLAPILQHWEMTDQGIKTATGDLHGVIKKFSMFQQSAEGHARAATSIASAEEEFKSHCNHLESLRDSIHYPFSECARLRDEAADLLRQAQEICSQAGI